MSTTSSGNTLLTKLRGDKSARLAGRIFVPALNLHRRAVKPTEDGEDVLEKVELLVRSRSPKVVAIAAADKKAWKEKLWRKTIPRMILAGL